MLRRKSEAGNVGVEVQGGSSEDIDTKPWTEIHERGTQADIWGRVCSRQRAQQVQRPWGRSLPRMLDQQSVNSVVPAEWREVNRQTAEAREVGRPDHRSYCDDVGFICTRWKYFGDFWKEEMVFIFYDYVTNDHKFISLKQH